MHSRLILTLFLCHGVWLPFLFFSPTPVNPQTQTTEHLLSVWARGLMRQLHLLLGRAINTPQRLGRDACSTLRGSEWIACAAPIQCICPRSAAHKYVSAGVMTELRAAISSVGEKRRTEKKKKKLSSQGSLTNVRLGGDHRSLLYGGGLKRCCPGPLPLHPPCS